jgi:predicted nucleic acid-binding protein
MRTAIDTNVVSALWSAEPLSGQVSQLLGEARSEGGLVISAVVHAELMAHPKATEEFVDEFLATTGVEIDFDFGEDVWREAARRFARYVARRRASRGGSPKRLLADFLVAAHAMIRADRLLTADEGYYRLDFPELEISAG